jgi:hypothetical protein
MEKIMTLIHNTYIQLLLGVLAQSNHTQCISNVFWVNFFDVVKVVMIHMNI